MNPVDRARQSSRYCLGKTYVICKVQERRIPVLNLRGDWTAAGADSRERVCDAWMIVCVGCFLIDSGSFFSFVRSFCSAMPAVVSCVIYYGWYLREGEAAYGGGRWNKDRLGKRDDRGWRGSFYRADEKALSCSIVLALRRISLRTPTPTHVATHALCWSHRSLGELSRAVSTWPGF